MGARNYKPSWGRFLSPDPIGLAGGINLFAFVGASPLTRSDPSGLSEKKNTNDASSDADSRAYKDRFARVGPGFVTQAFNELWNDAWNTRLPWYETGLAWVGVLLTGPAAGLETFGQGI
jgi:uncharacterized protein RhaS with RHS repeats